MGLRKKRHVLWQGPLAGTGHTSRRRSCCAHSQVGDTSPGHSRTVAAEGQAEVLTPARILLPSPHFLVVARQAPDGAPDRSQTHGPV